jgi:hypothetical protein
MTHDLKTVQPYFERAKSGEKPFEFRKNDRDFQTGDFVYLREYDPKENIYSGDVVCGTITYVLREYPGLEPGYCVFGYKKSELCS